MSDPFSETRPRPNERRTILIADDDPVSLALLETTLGLLEPEPRLIPVDDGAKAIAAIDELTPDLVITDLRMPGADGLQVLASVVNRRLSAPVIVISGHSTPEIRETVLGQGALLTFEKPIDPTQLIDTIRDLFAAEGRGHLEGFTLAGILQLIEMERKSCEVTVRGGDGDGGADGRLVLADGRLVHATAAGLEGDEAALEILSWTSPQVAIREAGAVPRRTVDSNMTHLLLESARLDDQENRELYETLDELGEQAAEIQEAEIADRHRTVLEELRSLHGFISASLLDLTHRRALLTLGETFERAETVAQAACRLLRAEREIAEATGEACRSDVMLRHRSQWHLFRGLPGQRALHLVLDESGNAAMAGYRLDRWLDD